MKCFVYRSSKKEGLYVYVREKNMLEKLPAALQQEMGQAEYAMSIELSESKKLNTEDPVHVMQNLETHGFHVQMPQDIESVLADLARPVTKS